MRELGSVMRLTDFMRAPALDPSREMSRRFIRSMNASCEPKSAL